MAQLGQPMSSQELKEFIEEIDIDGNGMVEFNEFLEMMVKKNPSAIDGKDDRTDDIAIAFKVIGPKVATNYELLKSDYWAVSATPPPPPPPSTG